MQRTSITNLHLVVAQKIIAFVQEQGWDIEGIEVYRYDDNGNPLIDHSGEDWKGRKMKWGLRLNVGPRDDEELVPKRQTVSE